MCAPMCRALQARSHGILCSLLCARLFLSSSRSTELALLLRQSFESVILTSLYPGSHISLHVQILQNDGGAFAASVNALTLALQNAGIPMRDMLCACSVGLGDNSTPLLDLNFSERSSDTPELVCASMTHSNRIVMVQEENKMNLEQLQSMCEIALEGNQKIFQILKLEVRCIHTHARDAEGD